ncbi:hypothetical protein L6452_09335 [Arctium lappa]|uniref:Uncharacterized protein n=1 Tax=Arctium lappa TaxID=4217 RepID=A0ACB9DK92_ARCLA|nr:hypothetical protein L6452_09335 [Arctium lappa]
MATLAVVLVLHLVVLGRMTAATWCVARSDAAQDLLQMALDYACGAGGADCLPIQESGPCFLPDTVQAHASYAFNSYYMRTSMASTSCDFSGTATIAKTDPSYGSCVYPASPSTAGKTPGPVLLGNAAVPPPPNATAMGGSEGAVTPTNMVPVLADGNPPASGAFTGLSISRLLFMGLMFMDILFMFQPMDIYLHIDSSDRFVQMNTSISSYRILHSGTSHRFFKPVLHLCQEAGGGLHLKEKGRTKRGSDFCCVLGSVGLGEICLNNIFSKQICSSFSPISIFFIHTL